jgi:hypothetical protein
VHHIDAEAGHCPFSKKRGYPKLKHGCALINQIIEGEDKK